MQGKAIVSKGLGLLLCLAAAAFSSAAGTSGTSAESTARNFGALDIVVTRIPPVQQDYGVGTVQTILSYPEPQCYTESRPLTAGFHWLLGGSKYVWVIWDMTAVPQDAQIISVEIEHELEPNAGNQPGIRLQYRSLGRIYLPPPDCWVASSDAYTGSVYTDVEMGTSAGTRRYALGGSAVPDATGAARGRGCFSLWIVAAGKYGWASVPGWSAGGPELIVTWGAPIAVERESWSTLKTLFHF
jgi:hypothetical protein